MRRSTYALLVSLLFGSASFAQSPAPATSVPRVVRLDGQFVPVNGLPPAAVEAVTLAIYASPADEQPLWSETQEVRVDAQGRYVVFLGASTADGIPASVLSGERWLGIRVDRPGETEQPRVPMTSVPYALRASDADTLGGLPPTAFLRAPSRAGRDGTAGAASAAGTDLDRPAVNTGTANYIGKFTNAIDLTSSVLYETGGRIGLGTTTPGDVLHTRFTDTSGALTGIAVQNLGSSSTSFSGMLFYDQTGALGQFQGFNNSTHEYRINNIAGGGSINFMLGGSSRFQVASNGNIGIATTTAPPEALTLNGNIQFTRDAARTLTVATEPTLDTPGQSLTVRAGHSNQGFGGFAVGGGALVLQAGNGYNANQAFNGGNVNIRSGANWLTAQPGFANGGAIVFETGGPTNTFVERMRITETGIVQPGANGTQNLGSASLRWAAVFAANGTIQTSDARLKTAVAGVGYGLREVLQLRPVRFQWKDAQPGRFHLGLIAQEAEQVIPELVERSDDPAAPLGMSYTSLTPVLIKAIQEQQAVLDQVLPDLAALKQQVADLQAALARALAATATSAAGPAKR